MVVQVSNNAGSLSSYLRRKGKHGVEWLTIESLRPDWIN